MRKIDKINPPARFIEYIQLRNPEDPSYIPSFDAMDTAIKEALKLSLLNEQGWICAYCQEQISNLRKAKIEHHCEQAICNGVTGQDKRLDYKNLFAVCFGGRGTSNLHCDASKSNFNLHSGLPIEINPLVKPHIDGIKYSTTGRISSTNNRHHNELNTILNLNCERLKSLRGEKYRYIFYLSGDITKRKGREKMKRLLEADLASGNGRFPYPFPGMSEYMLKNYT